MTTTISSADSVRLLSNTDCIFNAISDGLCTYNFTDPPVFFTLGGAVAAFGLIFAVYQLRRKKWDVVLRIRSKWQRDLFWWFGAAGLLTILARVLITNVPFEQPTLYSIPLIYEILAYVFFIASPASLLLLASRSKNLYTKRSARRFYEVIVGEISTSSEESLSASLDVLLANFDSICKAAKSTERDSDYHHSAIAILDVVLSDKLLVTLLTTKRLDALLHILDVVKDRGITQNESRVGVPKIFHSLFFDSESFFYKQFDRDGLALSSNVYESIFETPHLSNNFDIFGYPTFKFGAPNLTSSGIRVLIEAVTLSIKTYVTGGRIQVRHINNGISLLSDLFAEICSRIQIEEGREIDTHYSMKNEWWDLHTIASFFGHDYLFIASREQENLDQNITEHEKTAQRAKLLSHHSLNESIAGALYKGMESLSYFDDSNDIYRKSGELLHGVFFQTDLREGFRKPFEIRMWKQIGNNVIGKFYPPTTKAYLTNMGFYLGKKDEKKGEGWINGQIDRTRRLLYVDIKPLLEKEEKMVDGTLMKDALLPDSMDFQDGQFFYTYGFGKGERKTIPAPELEAESALSDYDPDDKLDHD